MGYLISPRSPRKRDKHWRKAKEAFSRATDTGVNPLIHRVAASQNYNDRLVDVQTQWTCRDLAMAHRWLDAIAEANEIETPSGS